MTVLSLDDVREHLGTLQYRPGWSWEANLDPWEGMFVRFLVDVPDSYNPGETTTLGINSWLPPMQTREQLDLWFQWRVWRIEGHEAREFLQRDGRPLFDPHAVER